MQKITNTVSIVVPTYNECENVQPLVAGINEALGESWNYEIIFVDDSSPDGTSEIVRRLSVVDPRVVLLKRPRKLGLGSALVDGFRIARGDLWVMMDGDLSHRPADLPLLLRSLEQADIVIGSRYTSGGEVLNWPVYRRFASRLAAAVGRLIVGLQVQDLTSGFAAFHRSVVEPSLPHLNPRGFKLLLEILAHSSGSIAKEVPIKFVDRQLGKSKFCASEAFTFLLLCFSLRHAVTD